MEVVIPIAAASLWRVLRRVTHYSRPFCFVLIARKSSRLVCPYRLDAGSRHGLHAMEAIRHPVPHSHEHVTDHEDPQRIAEGDMAESHPMEH